VPPASRTGRQWRRVKARVIRRDHGICHLCGQAGADSADHLIPVAHGGSIYSLANLAAAHIGCNKVRGVRPIDVVRAELTAAHDAAATGWSW
jgi:5-methylcytosine-specific restriction endonuclease McrA